MAEGELVETSASVSPSTLIATLRGIADDNAVWRIVRDDGSEATLRGASLRQSVPPGAYTIEAELADQSWRKEIQVGFGTVETVALNE